MERQQPAGSRASAGHRQAVFVGHLAASWALSTSSGQCDDVYCTPTASVAQGSCGVYYVASASPVTISLPGTTPDANGNLHILIGQQCSAKLNGIPSGCTASLQWTATGNTLQGWTGVFAGNTATISGPANPYTWSQASLTAAGSVWYWSDTAGSKTVTCTATVTPPSGQGNPFTVTATQTVILDVPTPNEMDTANPPRIDSLYPPVTGPALWAGSTVANHNGSQWNDSVTIPLICIRAMVIGRICKSLQLAGRTTQPQFPTTV